MKKILSLLLTIISLTVVICSCGQVINPVETQTDSNGEIITTTTAKQTTSKSTEKETTSTIQKSIETTKKNDSTEFPEDHYVKIGYPVRYKYIETPTRVIIPIREFTYYSKLDNERYYFCFDPLCDHNRMSCVACIFGGAQDGVYSSYTNRLYVERRDTLYSMKFDGSDIKIEVSFGDVGSDISQLHFDKGPNARIMNLQIYDNYLYFIYPTFSQEEWLGTGYIAFWSLFRYNLKTKKLENLSENVGHVSTYFQDFILTKNKIYFYDLDEDGDVYFFSANLDFTEINKTSLNKNDYFDKDFMIYDGEKLYSMYVEYKNGETSSVLPTVESYQIVCFNPETETVLGVSEKSYYSAEKSSGIMTLYAVTDDYIYYTVSEPFYIGTKHTKSGDRAVYNHRHTIYRMNKDGSDKKVVFEGVTSKDPKVTSYEINELYILEGGKKAIALVSADQYSTPIIMPNGYESANWQRSVYASFDIDDNGNFVNMHELELDIDE